MFYCPNCCRFRETDRCPFCGEKHLRAPAAGDMCFLEDVEYLWAGMLEDVLRQNGIAWMTRTDRSAAVAAEIGRVGQHVRFYVHYEDYSRAKDLVDSLFHMPENAPIFD